MVAAETGAVESRKSTGSGRPRKTLMAMTTGPATRCLDRMVGNLPTLGRESCELHESSTALMSRFSSPQSLLLKPDHWFCTQFRGLRAVRGGSKNQVNGILTQSLMSRLTETGNIPTWKSGEQCRRRHQTAYNSLVRSFVCQAIRLIVAAAFFHGDEWHIRTEGTITAMDTSLPTTTGPSWSASA